MSRFPSDTHISAWAGMSPVPPSGSKEREETGRRRCRTYHFMAYHIIKEQRAYNELGAYYMDRLNEQRLVKRLTLRIKALGYEVDFKKLPGAA